jgi:hypothetical protein
MRRGEPPLTPLLVGADEREIRAEKCGTRAGVLVCDELAAGRRARETGAAVVWGRKRQHGRVYVGGRSEEVRGTSRWDGTFGRAVGLMGESCWLQQSGGEGRKAQVLFWSLICLDFTVAWDAPGSARWAPKVSMCL